MTSPKQTFQADVISKRWQDTADSTMFKAAVDTALLEHSFRLPQAGDMGAASANHWKAVGAREVLTILSELALKPEKSTQSVKGKINYTV